MPTVLKLGLVVSWGWCRLFRVMDAEKRKLLAENHRLAEENHRLPARVELSRLRLSAS